ncbi:uncharacterized protein L201_000019 [Kwoniella dendrophila CBS 6074]|uniref:Mesaconyl-C4 CoA hydratase n=1 Tax=Kwoniella dendrophila CBS 6074 TaxID=1295534 RepID=A0AAX4JI66_9TREE
MLTSQTYTSITRTNGKKTIKNGCSLWVKSRTSQFGRSYGINQEFSTTFPYSRTLSWQSTNNNNIIPNNDNSIPNKEIQEWIQDLSNRSKKYDYDTIDIERISQLRRILPTSQSSKYENEYRKDVKIGDDLQPSHHLVLFRPKFMLKDLGLDGSFTEYNAPFPYTRRMWAGGSINWSKDNTLKIGDDVTQITTIPKIEFKKDMIFVNQQLKIYSGVKKTEDDQNKDQDEDEWSIKEIRTHVFRKPSESAAKVKLKPTLSTSDESSTTEKETKSLENVEKGAPNFERNDRSKMKDKAPVSKSEYESELSDTSIQFEYLPNSTLLFLYSALTNNPHKIHYDLEWTQQREGHSKPLVHGPLNATLLIELSNKFGLNRQKQLKEFQYRAVNPMTIDKEIRLSGNWTDNNKDNKESLLELNAAQSGKIGMKATATYYN